MSEPEKPIHPSLSAPCLQLLAELRSNPRFQELLGQLLKEQRREVPNYNPHRLQMEQQFHNWIFESGKLAALNWFVVALLGHDPTDITR